MKKTLIALLFLFSTTMAQSAENASPETSSLTEQQSEADKSLLEKSSELTKKTMDQVSNALLETRSRREKANYFALLNYTPIDLLIPSKYGITLGLINNADKTWELEYLQGSLSVPFLIKDLGTATDRRISLIKRNYYGGDSFNFSYGLSYHSFSIHLGDALLSRVSGGNYPSIDLVETNSLGFNMAIGNRWTFSKNITFGVDWISWSQPVYSTNKKASYLDYASNQEDKDNVESALKIISYFPRFGFLKFQLGILF